LTHEDTNEQAEAYFADDDLFTEYESQKQDSGEDFAWFKLANGEMSYTIEGLYDGNDELYSASALEKNPPVLRVGKKENDEIQFFSMRVNKEIADSLLFHMKAVDGAYRGVDVRHTEKPFSGEWFSRVASDAIDKIQEHPILSIFVGIILLFCLYSILTNQ
jgi:hypothetical protein